MTGRNITPVLLTVILDYVAVHTNNVETLDFKSKIIQIDNYNANTNNQDQDAEKKNALRELEKIKIKLSQNAAKKKDRIQKLWK